MKFEIKTKRVIFVVFLSIIFATLILANTYFLFSIIGWWNVITASILGYIVGLLLTAKIFQWAEEDNIKKAFPEFFEEE
jgi:ABC-type maltose transport system permease subunit